MTKRYARHIRTEFELDLNLLVAFDLLMAERNVTRAAERNGLTQPAVSKALNRLRYLFGDPLFVRRDRAMEPTARALELAGPIYGALAAISRTLTLPTAFDPATVSAIVKIATIDLYHMNLLPALVRHLRRYAPGVDMQVRANDCSSLREQLADGEIDLAFAPLGNRTGDLTAEPLWSDHLVTLVGPNNPLPDCMSLEAYAAAEHLVDAGHVQVSPDGVGTSVVDAILTARGLRRRTAHHLAESRGHSVCSRRNRPDRHLAQSNCKGSMPGAEHSDLEFAISRRRSKSADVLASPHRR